MVVAFLVICVAAWTLIVVDLRRGQTAMQDTTQQINQSEFRSELVQSRRSTTVSIKTLVWLAVIIGGLVWGGVRVAPGENRMFAGPALPVVDLYVR
jgi:hypothetical protein